MIKLSLQANESLVVNDPKAELYEKCANKAQEEGYKVILLDFDTSKYGNSWNPLDYIYKNYKENNHDLSIKLLEDLGYYLFIDENENNSDPFWINTTIDYFTGLVLYLFENAKEEEINFNSVYDLSNQIETSGAAEKIIASLPPTNPANINLTSTLLAPNETRGGILSVFRQALGLLISKVQLSSLFSSSDFNLEELTNDKFALFVIGEPSKSNAKYMTTIIEELYYVVNAKGSNTRRINIILDRFTELSPIEDFHNVLSRSRFLNIRFTMLIDSISSLVLLYGREETLLMYNNIPTIIYLYSSDEDTLRKISELAGEESENNPLISAQELKTFKMFDALILKVREYPIKTKLIPDFQLPWNMSEEETPLPDRIKKELKIYHI
jgi:type IV secretion system protein VirD4